MFYVILAVLLVVIDQAVKFAVRANIGLGQSIPFIPHVLDLAYVEVGADGEFDRLVGEDQQDGEDGVQHENTLSDGMRKTPGICSAYFSISAGFHQGQGQMTLAFSRGI